MSKAVEKLILWMWIGTTSILDLSLVVFALPTIGHIDYFNAGSYFDESVYTQSIYAIIVTQIIVSFLFLCFGLVWSAIVLIASERLLVFLKFPTPGNRKFSRLSLALFKFALIAIVLTILIGNISLIYDQVQGRAALDPN
jgi:uncharacterized membrane protein YjgN (DUF898 family)